MPKSTQHQIPPKRTTKKSSLLTASPTTNTGKYKFKRASKACDQCRKSKTRCNYMKAGNNCFRCVNLKLDCSLHHNHVLDTFESSVFLAPSPVDNNVGTIENQISRLSKGASDLSASPVNLVNLEKKIEEIHCGVAELLQRSNNNNSNSNQLNSAVPIYVDGNDNEREGSQVQSQGPPRLDKLFFDVTPFRDIRTFSSLYNLPFSKELAYGIIQPPQRDELDPIKMGLLTEETATTLIQIFIEYYGKWSAFDNDTVSRTIQHRQMESIRKSPLLTATTCLLGLQHFEEASIQSLEVTHKQLLELLYNNLLPQSITQIPQSQQTIQSLLLISCFSQSLSQDCYYFDAWYISGYSLIQFITREMDLNLLSDRFKSHPNRIANFRLWNQLSLIHLSNCILSGRPCLIDTVRLDQCREILDIFSADNFDGFVVACIGLLLSVYNSLLFEENLENSCNDLDLVLNDWDHLLVDGDDDGDGKLKLGGLIKITFGFSKVMLFRRELLKLIGATSEDYIFNEGHQTNDIAKLKKTASELVNCCMEVIEAALESDELELMKSNDITKFFLIFATSTLINVYRQFYSGDSEDKQRVHDKIGQAKQMFQVISQNYLFPNHFTRGCIELINRFCCSLVKL